MPVWNLVVPVWNLVQEPYHVWFLSPNSIMALHVDPLGLLQLSDGACVLIRVPRTLDASDHNGCCVGRVGSSFFESPLSLAMEKSILTCKCEIWVLLPDLKAAQRHQRLVHTPKPWTSTSPKASYSRSSGFERHEIRGTLDSHGTE